MAFDIWDQAVLTSLVNDPVDTRLETTPYLGSQIAPLNNVQSRMVRMQYGKTYSFGIGQFKAPNAMPALIDMPTSERSESLMELVQLEEMHRINGEQWQKLQSSDENIRTGEGLDVVERGRILRTRLERLTEWMRWQAFTTGSLTVTYPRTNSQVLIDYGWLAGHKPVPSTAWTDRDNSDPVADLQAWQNRVTEDAGYPATKIHITTTVRDLILTNANLRNYYNVEAGTIFRPTLDMVTQLLAEGTEFVTYDAGFRPMASAAERTDAAHTRYLPVNKVLITTPYQVDGENIADTMNGQLEIGTDYNQTAIAQGPLSEVILDHMTKNRYLRQGASRIVRILHPEAFLCATVAS